MIDYYTNKKELYNAVDNLKENVLDLTDSHYPISTVSLCQNFSNIRIASVPFRSYDLRGMVVIADNDEENNVILLNARLDEQEKKFYCGHELLHLHWHANKNGKQFNCYEKLKPNQDATIEWQANEGSAELLVPYRQFLPLVAKAYDTFTQWEAVQCFVWNAAKRFNVTTTVIETRLESLKYEINQYLNSTPLDKIDILSDSKQKLYGIHVESINDLGAKLYRQTPKRPKKQSIHSLIEIIKDD